MDKYEEGALTPSTKYEQRTRRRLSREQDLEKMILMGFTPEQRKKIKRRQKILSSLAFFIGKIMTGCR